MKPMELPDIKNARIAFFLLAFVLNMLTILPMLCVIFSSRCECRFAFVFCVLLLL